MEGVDQRSVSTFGSKPEMQKLGINIHPSTPKLLGSASPPHRLHYPGGSSHSSSLTQLNTPSSTTSYDSESVTGNMVVEESIDVRSYSPSVFINRWHALQVGHNISPHKGHRRSRSDSPLKISGFMHSSSSSSLLVSPGENNVDGYSGDEPMNNGDKEKKGKTTSQHSSNISIGAKTSQTTMELEYGDFNTEELKKIMENGKHVEVALNNDPKREKRLLANRQSAARSRERKSKYICELENKVKMIELEATTLSAKFTNLQKDHSELKRENNKYKFRLQAIQKLSQLKDALNQTLNDEVQRLRQVVAELGGDHTSCMARQLAINQQIFQFQHQESNQDIHFLHTQEDRQ